MRPRNHFAVTVWWTLGTLGQIGWLRLIGSLWLMQVEVSVSPSRLAQLPRRTWLQGGGTRKGRLCAAALHHATSSPRAGFILQTAGQFEDRTWTTQARGIEWRNSASSFRAKGRKGRHRGGTGESAIARRTWIAQAAAHTSDTCRPPQRLQRRRGGNISCDTTARYSSAT